MRPQDIDKIANLVVKALAASPETGLLGCGSMSSTAEYAPDCTWNNPYECGAGGYECGVAALFSCDIFYCGEGSYVFMCGGPFTCEAEFHCWGGPGYHLFAPPLR